jgi:hypothetical protein
MPYGVSILDIEVVTVAVDRGVIVTVTRQSHELGISVETVAAGCVRDEPEEVLRTEIVDPRQGSLRRRYHILSFSVVKISVFHKNPFPNEYVFAI